MDVWLILNCSKECGILAMSFGIGLSAEIAISKLYVLGDG